MNADLTAVAAEAMGAVDSRFVAALSGTPGGAWTAATGAERPGSATYGIALLSRLPVVWWRVIRLPALATRVPVWFRGDRRPRAVRDEPRVAVAAVVEAPAGQMTVATTHLSFVPGWNSVQLRRLMRSLTAHPGAVGAHRRPEHGARQAERASGLRSIAIAPTFPAEAPLRQLDHVLVGGPLAAVGRAEAVRLPLSDHRALLVSCEPVQRSGGIGRAGRAGGRS